MRHANPAYQAGLTRISPVEAALPMPLDPGGYRRFSAPNRGFGVNAQLASGQGATPTRLLGKLVERLPVALHDLSDPPACLAPRLGVLSLFVLCGRLAARGLCVRRGYWLFLHRGHCDVAVVVLSWLNVVVLWLAQPNRRARRRPRSPRAVTSLPRSNAFAVGSTSAQELVTVCRIAVNPAPESGRDTGLAIIVNRADRRHSTTELSALEWPRPEAWPLVVECSA